MNKDRDGQIEAFGQAPAGSLEPDDILRRDKGAGLNRPGTRRPGNDVT